LEESRGALYEIGVSDDGTLVGLTKDEMDESITNLKAMAASLGCNVEVVRMVVVGECEWHETPNAGQASGPSAGRSAKVEQRQPLRHQEQLWVAEALVTPDLSAKTPLLGMDVRAQDRPRTPTSTSQQDDVLEDQQLQGRETTEQLRVTFTGPTTSGKSTLLGTLSTATLDNGRGKSRLSLLNHRHERASGVTSSVTHELIGYKNDEVINFASGNVTSWNDIHASAETGRLVFISDCPGHPR